MDIACDAAGLAGACHFDAGHRVSTVQATVGEHGRLDADIIQVEWIAPDLAAQAEHATHCFGREVDAENLAHERQAARRAQIAFNHLDHVVLGDELHVERASDVQFPGELSGNLTGSAYRLQIQHLGWQHHGGVTAVHSCIFDVLADGPQDDVALVGHGIDFDFPSMHLELRDDDRVVR